MSLSAGTTERPRPRRGAPRARPVGAGAPAPAPGGGAARRGGVRARGVPPVLGRALGERRGARRGDRRARRRAACASLELGCGLGVPSLAAALAGAAVLATDWSPTAIALLEENARRNDVRARDGGRRAGRTPTRSSSARRGISCSPRTSSTSGATSTSCSSSCRASARRAARRPRPPSREDVLRGGGRGLGDRAERDRLRAHRRRHEHALSELDEPVRVAPLVVVPRDDLHLRAVDDRRQRRVEDRRVRRPDDVASRRAAPRCSAGCPRARRRPRAPRRARSPRRPSSARAASIVRSTSEPVGTGTRTAKPCSLPSSSGITRPIAFAAPVDVGTRFAAAARARRRSLCGASASRWSLGVRVHRRHQRRGGCRSCRAAPSRPARGSSSCTTRSR